MLDMGDFAGGLLKYLRRHPLPRLTIAGGFIALFVARRFADRLLDGLASVALQMQMKRREQEITDRWDEAENHRKQAAEELETARDTNRRLDEPALAGILLIVS